MNKKNNFLDEIRNNFKLWQYPFYIFGILTIITPAFWLIQAFAYTINQKQEDFFSFRFHRVTYKIGLFFTMFYLIFYLLDYIY